MKKKQQYLDDKKAWTTVIAIAPTSCAIIFAIQYNEGILYNPEIILFGIFSFTCSLAFGYRFWDITFGVTKFSDNNIDKWELFGVYKNIIGWSTQLEWIVDHAIVINSGFLIGFFSCPQLWLLSALSLFSLAFIRHSLALYYKKGDDHNWRGKIDAKKIVRVENYLQNKQRFSIIYLLIFLCGIIFIFYPTLIIIPIIRFILSNSNFISVVYIFLIFLLLVLRFITHRNMKEKLNRFNVWWEERKKN